MGRDGSVDWGDYDNDGDLNLALSGAGLERALIYQNQGNDTFSVLPYEDLPSVVNSAIAWGDYDLDGDLDLLIAGQEGSQTLTEIWENTNPVIAFSQANYNVAENAGTLNIGVQLDQVLAEDIAVNYSSSNGTASAGSDYSAINGSLSIPAGSTSANFTLSITDDALPEGDEALILSLSNPISVALGMPYTATVTIVDDEILGSVSISPTSVNVGEDGTTDTYSLVLGSEPSSDVTITLSPDGQTQVSSSTLTFTSANWQTPQTVTVSAVDDAFIEGLHSETITHSVSSGDGDYNGLSVISVTVDITDNDGANVIISPTTLSLVKGSADSYEVVLTSEPTAPVTVSLGLGGEAQISVSSLTFTDATWDIAQTVLVTATDDALVEGVHNETITHSVSSGDGVYNGISINTITANINDDDNAGISITPTDLNLDKSNVATTANYSVTLTSEPTANVDITITTDGETSIDPTSLNFTSGTWNTTQVVTVTVIDDEDVEGPHIGTISHTVSSGDGNYNNFSASDVLANISDDDGVYENVSEAISYTMVYAVDIPTNADYDSGSPTYFIDNSASIGTFDRIAYYMVLSDSWVYASMPAYTSTVAHIGVPVQSLGITVTAITTDMNIYYKGGGSDLGVKGGLEFWPHAYATDSRPEVQTEGGGSSGLGSIYDWNDTYLPASPTYSGSLQIGHYKTTAETKCCTVLAWNNWDSPAVDDVGINGTYYVGAPTTADFTNFANATDYTTRTLYVLVRETPVVREPVVSRVPQAQAQISPEKLAEYDALIASLAPADDITGRSAITGTNETDIADVPENITVIGAQSSIRSAETGGGFKISGNSQSRGVYQRANTSLGVSTVLTPTFPAAITSTNALSIAGFIASDQEVDAVDVTINGASIYNPSYGAGITQTLWATTWTPPGEGIYTVEAELTNGNSQTVLDETDTKLYVDLNAPELSLTTERISLANYQSGRFVLTGLATDTLGLVQVQAKVADGDWQTAKLSTTPEGVTVTGYYTATLFIDNTTALTNTSYTVTLRVTDRGGRRVDLQQVLPADTVAPALTGLSLMAEGQAVQPGETIDWAATRTHFAQRKSYLRRSIGTYHQRYPKL